VHQNEIKIAGKKKIPVEKRGSTRNRRGEKERTKKVGGLGYFSKKGGGNTEGFAWEKFYKNRMGERGGGA